MDDKKSVSSGDATNASRREIALGLLGAIAGSSLLKACASSDAGPPTLDTDEAAGPASALNALTGTGSLRWFDKMEGTAADPGLADTVGSANELAVLLGYYAPGDGGGGLFVWSTQGTWNGANAIDDRGTVINPSARRSPGLNQPAPTSAAGWRRLRVSKEINVKWFGAKGDGQTSDTAAIQLAFDAASNKASEVFLPFGHYRVDETLYLGKWQAGPWGIRVIGEAAGWNDGDWTQLKWAGQDNSGPMMWVNGFDHRFEQLLFNGQAASASSIKDCGVSVGGGLAAPQSGASHVLFERCAWSGFKIGCALNYSGTLTSNVELCGWVDCAFGCYDAGVWINGAQPYGTHFDRVVFVKSPPPGRSTGDNPYGVGIRVGVNGEGIAGSVWVRQVSFAYLAYGVQLLGSPQSVHVQDVDTENTKKLLYSKGMVAQNTTITIANGRYALSAIRHARTGEMLDPADNIAAADGAYIDVVSGSLTLMGNAFFDDYQPINAFKIKVGGSAMLQSFNNIYQTPTPFQRTASNVLGTAANGTNHALYNGKTYSRGDVYVGPDNPYFAAGNWGTNRLPDLEGCENPSKTVTIAGTNTTAQVTFDIPEHAYISGTNTYVDYSVRLSIDDVTPGAVVTTPYVSARTSTGFTVNLSSAPGANKSVTIRYQPFRV